jgi:hypothetical protein
MQKKDRRELKKNLPLQPTLVITVILAILTTAIGIALPLYFTTKDSLKILWKDLGVQTGISTSARSLRYLHDAINFIDYWNTLASKNQFPFEEISKLLNTQYVAIKTNKFFDWVAYSTKEGNYYAV